MARPVITYERGSTYISHVSKKSGTCCGLVGTLTIAGLTFDTLERFDMTPRDYVHLPAGDFARAIMYWHSEKARIIHPWAGDAPSEKQENIFVHKGSLPADFEGCIGVGFLTRAGSAFALQRSESALEDIWKLVGGVPKQKEGWNAKSPRVVLRVTAPFPDRKTLKPHAP